MRPPVLETMPAGARHFEMSRRHDALFQHIAVLIGFGAFGIAPSGTHHGSEMSPIRSFTYKGHAKRFAGETYGRTIAPDCSCTVRSESGQTLGPDLHGLLPRTAGSTQRMLDRLSPACDSEQLVRRRRQNALRITRPTRQ